MAEAIGARTAGRKPAPWKDRLASREGQASEDARGDASRQMPISSLRHPSSAREVALEGPSSAIRVALRIDVQHDPWDVAPIGAFLIGIKHTEIRYEMFLVVCSECWIGGRQIRDIRIEWRLFDECSRDRWRCAVSRLRRTPQPQLRVKPWHRSSAPSRRTRRPKYDNCMTQGTLVNVCRKRWQILIFDMSKRRRSVPRNVRGEAHLLPRQYAATASILPLHLLSSLTRRAIMSRVPHIDPFVPTRTQRWAEAQLEYPRPMNWKT